MTDEKTIELFLSTGEQQYLGPLFKKYKDKLFGLAYYYLHNREDALDSVMECYEVILKSIASKEVTYFKGWAMSICRNICLKKLRDTKKYSELSEIAENSVENNEDSVYSNENVEKVLDLVTQLKEPQRVCIEAFYLKGKSYEDISKTYQMELKDVKSKIQNGKRNLKLLFERSGSG